jgi:phage baseplate assembly protein gpV
VIRMEQLVNALKGYAAGLDQLQGLPRLAIISSVDAKSACARVLHQPEGILSGWLPILSLWSGDGWGLVCLPAVGDQVLVLSHDGDPSNGIVVGSLYSDKRKVPATPPGEFWLLHRSGSYIKLIDDGTVQIAGDLHVAGEVFDRSGSLSRLRTAHNMHLHTDALGRTTSAPTTKDQ